MAVRIIHIDERESPRRSEWLVALDTSAAASREVLKRDGPSVVYAAHIARRDVVVKRRSLTAWDRLRAMIGSGRGFDQWRGTRLLQGVTSAARALVLVQIEADELLLLERVPGPTLLEVLAGHATIAPRRERTLAVDIGLQVGLIASARLRNRDHKPSNLIIADSGPTVIDAVGVRRGGSNTQDIHAAVAQMLTSLMLEAIGCGCVPRRSLRIRALLGAWSALNTAGSDRAARRAWVRGMSGAVESRIEAHGDPTPKINPLARSQ